MRALTRVRPVRFIPSLARRRVSTDTGSECTCIGDFWLFLTCAMGLGIVAEWWEGYKRRNVPTRIT